MLTYVIVTHKFLSNGIEVFDVTLKMVSFRDFLDMIDRYTKTVGLLREGKQETTAAGD